MKRPIAFAVLCTLLLSGCTQQTGAADPAAEEAGRVNAQMQALEQAEQAGPAGGRAFSAEQRRGARAGGRHDRCAGVYGRTERGDPSGRRRGRAGARVFCVRGPRCGGEPVGKVAVDRETGEKYYYLGDGVLEDYESFPLYDPEAERPAGWEGKYVNPADVSLTITEEQDGAFAYAFSDGTQGTAAVSARPPNPRTGRSISCLRRGSSRSQGGRPDRELYRAEVNRAAAGIAPRLLHI